MPNFRGTPRKLLSPLELIVHLPAVPLDRTRQSIASDNINPLKVNKHNQMMSILDNTVILNLPSSSSSAKSRDLLLMT